MYIIYYDRMFLLILMMCFVLPSTIPISARFMLHVGVTHHYEQQSDLANNMAPNHPQQQCVKKKRI